MEWPTIYRPLLTEYGPAVVWRAGLEALSFPPTWCDRFQSFEAVRLHLFNTFGVQLP